MTFRRPITVRSGARVWLVAHATGNTGSASVAARASAKHLVERWFLDHNLVRDYLPQLSAGLNEATSPGTRLDTARAKARISRAFATGELVILDAAPKVEERSVVSPPPLPPPPAPPPPPAKKAAPAEPEGPALPDPSVDQDDQAQALIQASEAGVPFCEE
ncbi:MAG TPA: hypothetical protein VGJ91_07850, partial [Polyangiaceae bacterium]